MKRKARGTHKPRHINRIYEVATTAQRNDSPAQTINQGFLKNTILTNVPYYISSSGHKNIRIKHQVSARRWLPSEKRCNFKKFCCKINTLVLPKGAMVCRIREL